MRKLTIEHAHKLAASRGGRCLSNEWVNTATKLTWECNLGHRWQATYNNIKHNKWCPVCYRLHRRGDQRRLRANIHHEIAAQNNGRCLTEIYRNNKQLLTWECELGHRWKARLDSIKDQGSWCPQCRDNKNYYESKTREIFEDIFKVKFERARPDFLKNPRTRCNLELDGYNKDLQLAFEYDGRMHYQEWDAKNPGKLRYTQENDMLKDELCRLNNVTLFRIPYWESKRLREYIENLVKDYVKENTK